MSGKDLYAGLAAGALETAPRTLLRRLPGREVFALESPQGGRVLVKRYHEPLAWPGPSPAEREAGRIRALAHEGFPVPRVLAVQARRRGLLERQSVLVIEWIEHRHTLRERLREAGGQESVHLARSLAGLVARLHSSGWHHRDLYLQHILLRGEELVLIDLGRVARTRRRRWFVKDLAALLHSCPAAVSLRSRLRFFVGYARLRGLPRGEARALLGGAIAKERRMARHQPRHGEEVPWTDR